MDGPKNTGKPVLVSRILFQIDQFAVEQVQVLGALDQEISNDLIGHSSNPRPTLSATPPATQLVLFRFASTASSVQVVHVSHEQAFDRTSSLAP
jgi:hypothetical protein